MPDRIGPLSHDRGGRHRAVAPPVAHFLEGCERASAPVLRHQPELQTDPHYRGMHPLLRVFHGDTGRGVGASHQTGWTSLIAKLLMPRAHD